MGKKQMLARLLDLSRTLELLEELLRYKLREHLLVFNYHRIRPDRAWEGTPFEDEVFSTRVSVFDEQVAWLKAHRRLIGEQELLETIERRPSHLRGCAMITFDDGYRDNYSLAFPALRRHGVPATFFIPSGLIESRRVGWWDLIAYLIKRTRQPILVLDGRAFRLPAERRQAISYFQGRWKNDLAATTRGLISALASACDVALPDSRLQDQQLMSWDQVREVAAAGITIGSHTHSHRVLGTLDPAAQRQELARSRTILEEQLGQPIRSIAYPVGEPAHITAETVPLAIECGYELGFSYLTGCNHWRSIEPMNVRRLMASEDLSSLAALAVLPGFFGRVNLPLRA